ncbi:MAG: IS110 family transposase [Bdellovibrionales bacterium]
MSYLHFFGIDVSKDHIDVAEHAKAAKPKLYPNSSEGFAAFFSDYADKLSQGFVVLEATGGYETALLHALCERNVAVHRAVPLQAKHFIRSLGKIAKTDKLDALALARYGFDRHEALPLFVRKSRNMQMLQDLLMRRADCIEMKKAEVNRAQHPRYASMKVGVAEHIDFLDKQIRLIGQQIKALVKASHDLQRKLDVMTQVKGIGQQTAFVLLGLMPELGNLTRRQAASLAGCAPHARDSGKMRGYRQVWGGRCAIKTALFMASLSACRSNAHLSAFYQRLLLEGKKKMVALNAVMRKLIVILNAKLRDTKNLLPA